jgi:hypothetical protein
VTTPPPGRKDAAVEAALIEVALVEVATVVPIAAARRLRPGRAVAAVGAAAAVAAVVLGIASLQSRHATSHTASAPTPAVTGPLPTSTSPATTPPRPSSAGGGASGGASGAASGAAPSSFASMASLLPVLKQQAAAPAATNSSTVPSPAVGCTAAVPGSSLVSADDVTYAGTPARVFVFRNAAGRHTVIVVRTHGCGTLAKSAF